MERANLPLAGVVVLDFGQVYQGPYATMLMAKGGADVIKIEPPNGEPLRRRAPPGKSTTFPIAMLNGNKRAITLNLKHERGRDLLFRMVEKADILLENFAPGVMDRLGVGYEVLSGINPRLVYASGTGFGLSGPDRDTLAMDLTIQAMGGLISVTGFPDGPPLKSGPAVVDFLSGIHLYAATITALFERERTGRGRKVEVAMQEAAYATLTSQLEAYWQTGKVPPRTGNASHGRVPINVYPTNDGYVAMNLAVEEHWHSLLEGNGPRGSARRYQVQLAGGACQEPRGNRRADRRLDADAWENSRSSRSPGGTASRWLRCAMSARSCTTRTCTSAAFWRISSTTRSARSRCRTRRCASTAPTRCTRSRARSSGSTTMRFMAAGSACRRPRSRR